MRWVLATGLVDGTAQAPPGAGPAASGVRWHLMKLFPILLPRATCGSWADPASAAGQGKTCVNKVSFKKAAVMGLCLGMTSSKQAC